MKRIIIFSVSILFLLTSSCDPDVPGEGVTLEPLNFSFSVSKDTAIHQINDTIKIKSSIPNNYNLNNGKIQLFFNIDFAKNVDTITDPSSQIKPAIENVDYKIEKIKGDIEYNTSVVGLMKQIILYPNSEEHLEFEYLIIPLKKGIYQLTFYSNFYESKEAKARTNAKFNVITPNWGFYKLNSGSIPSPEDEGYYNAFLFMVYE